MNKISNFLQKINIFRSLKLYRFQQPVIILMVVAIFLAVNFLLAQISLRLDFSKGRAYTLSQSTKTIAKNLDKSASITFYSSSNVPARLKPVQREVADLLNEYDQYGNISITIVDPSTNQEAESAAQQAGLQPLQFSQLERDQYAVSAGYLGIVIKYNEKQELLPQVTDINNLEYNITSALYKLSREELPKLAILAEEVGFMPQGDDLRTLKNLLSQQFTVENMFTSQPPDEELVDPEAAVAMEIPDGTDAVLVFENGSKEYPEDDLNVLKEYLQKGGKGIFFVPGVNVIETGDISASVAEHNLYDFVKQFGITVKNNLVLSLDAELVNFGNEVVSYFAAYPYWIKSNNFAESAYISNVGQLTFPWTSSVEVDEKKANTLVFSTNRSWSVDKNFVLTPNEIDVPNNNLSSLPLVAEAETGGNGKLMVIPSSRFVKDRYLSQSSQNLEFIFNVINDYASEGALSGIRQRAVTIYPLPEIPAQLQETYKYLNILLLPGLFAAYGTFRMWRRKKQ